ncbi:hypothetical protein DRN93_06095 [archaeon]|nr:MAG: hypothetical protein DRN93_06095 [archaeon]
MRIILKNGTIVILILIVIFNFSILPTSSQPQEQIEIATLLYFGYAKTKMFESCSLSPGDEFTYSVEEDPDGWRLERLLFQLRDMNVDPEDVAYSLETNTHFILSGSTTQGAWSEYYSTQREVFFRNKLSHNLQFNLKIRTRYMHAEEIHLEKVDSNRWRGEFSIHNIDMWNQSGIFSKFRVGIHFERRIMNITLWNPEGEVAIGRNRIMRDAGLYSYGFSIPISQESEGIWVFEAELGETKEMKKCFILQMWYENRTYFPQIVLKPGEELTINYNIPQEFYLYDISIITVMRRDEGNLSDLELIGPAYSSIPEEHTTPSGQSFQILYVQALGPLKLRNRGGRDIQFSLRSSIYVRKNIPFEVEENGSGILFNVPAEYEVEGFEFVGIVGTLLGYCTNIEGVFYRGVRSDHLYTEDSRGSQCISISFTGFHIDPYKGNMTNVGSWLFKADLPLLGISSEHGEVFGEGIYCLGKEVNFGVNQTIIDLGNDTCWMFTGWEGTGEGSYTGEQSTVKISFIKPSPIIESAIWRRGYKVRVTSPFGEITGEGWYPSGSETTVSIQPSTYSGLFTVKKFIGWYISGNLVSQSPHYTFTVNAPITIEARWREEPNWVNILLFTIPLFTGVVIAILLLKRRKEAVKEELPPPPPP